MTLYRSLALAYTGDHPGERTGCIDLLMRAREAIDRRDAQRERYGIIVAARVNQSADFDRFAGISGLITGFSSLLYAVFYLLVKGTPHDYLPSILLAIGGLLALPVTVAIYQRVRTADDGFALLALALGGRGLSGHGRARRLRGGGARAADG